jgi:hypothetical protein
MARIRSIKPDFFASEDVAALPLRARLLWIGLWTHCDDHGRTKRNAKLIKAAIWPLDDVSLRDIEEDLQVLADHGRIVTYEVGSTQLLAVVNWHAHQSINRPGKPKHPGPPSPLGAVDADDPNHCAECARPGPAPAEQYASEPRGATGNRPQPVDNRTKPHGASTEDSVSDQIGQTDVTAGQPTHGVFTEPSVSPHGGLTPGREGKGREGKGSAGAREGQSPSTSGAGPEPPSRCEEHQHLAKPPPCGRCADARKANERWQAERRARLAGSPHCPHHRGQPAHNCGPCRAEKLASPRLTVVPDG